MVGGMSYQNPPPHALEDTASSPARRWPESDRSRPVSEQPLPRRPRRLQVAGLVMVGGVGLAFLPITDRLWGIEPAWHLLPAIGGMLAFASIIYRQRHPGFWSYSGTPRQRLINVFAVIAVLAAVFAANAALAH